ncbi:hypothetical protein LDENG_00103930 [Lucifuga dentata]|nr:hypothetical protein LDENG_00103930 [Lucifuga dentata]
MVIHALISSPLDYCSSLFTCLSKTSLDWLQAVQNAAARLLAKANRKLHVTPMLSDLIKPDSASRSLRSSGQRLLVVPRTRLKTRGDHAFQAVAPKLWNALPAVRSADSEVVFRRKIKTFLFRQAFRSSLSFMVLLLLVDAFYLLIFTAS